MIAEMVAAELRVHWTHYGLRWVDIPARIFEAVGMHAAASWWVDLVSPIWNWLCDRQCDYAAMLLDGVSGS